jgi:RimJ/RimL family protein N-acetyltransferase
MDSIIETARLIIRQLNESDFAVLYEIMRKPEVMQKT